MLLPVGMITGVLKFFFIIYKNYCNIIISELRIEDIKHYTMIQLYMEKCFWKGLLQ